MHKLEKRLILYSRNIKYGQIVCAFLSNKEIVHFLLDKKIYRITERMGELWKKEKSNIMK